MKQILNLVIALLMCGNLISQNSKSQYRFRKPIAINSTSWEFKSVTSGVNAIVTIIGSKNATIDKIDDSVNFAYGWQPAIKYTSTMTKSTDSSYLEFKVEFIKSNTKKPSIQDEVSMTIVDADGNSAFREMIKTALPATSTGIEGSVLNISQDSRWLIALGATQEFSGMDTSVYIAMTQINLKNISSYIMRVGVLGKITANTVRQHSFYYKGFEALSIPLAVELTAFNAKVNNNTTELTWSTSSEENLSRFEVCRSTDGHNFFPVGTVNANINSNELINYNFTDFGLMSTNSQVIYYRLKMIDINGSVKLGNIAQVRVSNSAKTATVSVYPNPTSEIVNVGLANADGSDIKVSIIDAFGKTIQSATSSNTTMQFDVRNLENGIYFINILNSDGSTTSNKFIKR